MGVSRGVGYEGGQSCARRGQAVKGWGFGADYFQGVDMIKPGEKSTRDREHTV